MGEAIQTEETPGPGAQVIEALDEDKSENLSPVEEHDEVEITGASEHTSKSSMAEQITEEKKKKAELRLSLRWWSLMIH